MFQASSWGSQFPATSLPARLPEPSARYSSTLRSAVGPKWAHCQLRSLFAATACPSITSRPGARGPLDKLWQVANTSVGARAWAVGSGQWACNLDKCSVQSLQPDLGGTGFGSNPGAEVQPEWSQQVELEGGREADQRRIACDTPAKSYASRQGALRSVQEPTGRTQ